MMATPKATHPVSLRVSEHAGRQRIRQRNKSGADDGNRTRTIRDRGILSPFSAVLPARQSGKPGLRADGESGFLPHAWEIPANFPTQSSVRACSLALCKIPRHAYMCGHCGRGEIGIHTGLKIRRPRPCGFKSRRPHHASHRIGRIMARRQFKHG